MNYQEQESSRYMNYQEQESSRRDIFMLIAAAGFAVGIDLLFNLPAGSIFFDISLISITLLALSLVKLW